MNTWSDICVMIMKYRQHLWERCLWWGDRNVLAVMSSSWYSVYGRHPEFRPKLISRMSTEDQPLTSSRHQPHGNRIWSSLIGCFEPLTVLSFLSFVHWSSSNFNAVKTESITSCLSSLVHLSPSPRLSFSCPPSSNFIHPTYVSPVSPPDDLLSFPLFCPHNLSSLIDFYICPLLLLFYISFPILSLCPHLLSSLLSCPFTFLLPLFLPCLCSPSPAPLPPFQSVMEQ